MTSHLITSFEEFVQEADKAKTKSALFDIFLQTIGNHGLDRALFAFITDDKEINQKAGIGVIHNFPDDWMSYYFANGLDKIDPVPIYGASQTGAYTWADIPDRMKLTKQQEMCLNAGIESGLNNGVATYLRAASNRIAGMSLASSEGKDSFDGKISHITAYTNHFYIRYRELHGIQDPEPLNFCLTPREQEILTWAAAGKTDWETGVILTISTHTVDWHMRNILKKLDAPSKIVAIAKAYTYGLVHP